MTDNRVVDGSSPSPSTKLKNIVKAEADLLPLHGRIRRFESYTMYQIVAVSPSGLRHRVLSPTCVGSNPTTAASFC